MKALGTLFIAALLVIVAALVFIYSGWYNVSANSAHGAAARRLFGTVMRNSVRAHARHIVPPELSSQMARAGAGHFKEHCAECHGAPGVERGDIGRGLTPRPPKLADTAQNWSAGELYWIVRNGIKMTGMPAWDASHSDEEIWQTVAFVRLLPRMSPAEYQQMVTQAGPHGHAHAEEGGHRHDEHEH